MKRDEIDRSGSERPSMSSSGGAAVASGDPSALFEQHLPLVERVLGSIGARRCRSVDEAEDFASWARLKLLEEDCAILRKFRGRSSLKTYLVTVIQNLFRDYRIAKWGKWRPSAKAKRLGVDAVRLEILLYRDGLSFDEAAETLRRNHGVRVSLSELAELAGVLPPRVPRRTVGEGALDTVADDGKVDSRIRDGERKEAAERAERALSGALDGLDPEDRLILKMRYEDGFTVAAVARALGLDQKPLYRRIERCLVALRSGLEERGVVAEMVTELLGWSRLELHVDYGELRRQTGRESTASRPSQGRHPDGWQSLYGRPTRSALSRSRGAGGVRRPRVAGGGAAPGRGSSERLPRLL